MVASLLVRASRSVVLSLALFLAVATPKAMAATFLVGGDSVDEAQASQQRDQSSNPSAKIASSVLCTPKVMPSNQP